MNDASIQALSKLQVKLSTEKLKEEESWKTQQHVGASMIYMGVWGKEREATGWNLQSV